eukprot:CAMPEP_0194339744 /NCGR_PEP_ID=MMETSP0171-20130528/84208_1 /TAXON_ID=218684 /ORGANISM="Corethron pennatum, Strain L29A3" /LENGTH=72 /DNA_ID=CAMNT_0039104419 /DNA_START=1073 /DNA_END=1287 /DNA_ORIENTATION=+
MAFENAAQKNTWVFHWDGDYREYAVSPGRTFGPPSTRAIANGGGFDTRGIGNSQNRNTKANRLLGDGGGRRT